MLQCTLYIALQFHYNGLKLQVTRKYRDSEKKKVKCYVIRCVVDLSREVCF